MKDIRKKLYEVIFESETKAGRNFDLILIILIAISVILVILESVESINYKYGYIFRIMEWAITILFTLEYLLRIWTSRKPFKYIFSFYGIVDLVSTIPMYLSLFYHGYQFLIILRALRLLRIFKILKLQQYTSAGYSLMNAIETNKSKIIVLILNVLFISLVQGTLMYVVEGKESGFDNIPVAIYWSIVTITTVGYGDISPVTPLGQFIAATTMIIGYGIIAIGLVKDSKKSEVHLDRTNTQVCSNCMVEDHRDGASHCYNCGNSLN